MKNSENLENIEKISKTNFKKHLGNLYIRNIYLDVLEINSRRKVQQALLNKDKREEGKILFYLNEILELVEDLDESGVDYGSYLKEDFNTIIQNLVEFDKVSRENFFLFGNLKYENKSFLTQFKKTQMLNPKGMLGNSQSKIDSTFNELYRQYKSKGYEVPDLSVKNNIFEIDPLIIEEGRLSEFYNHQNREFLNTDTNLKFLENVSQDMVKRLNSNYINNQYQYFNSDLKRKEVKEHKEMKKAIRSTLHHNNLIKSYFEFKNDKEAAADRLAYNQDNKNENEIGNFDLEIN